MKNKNELTTQMQRVVENIREPIDTMTIRDQFAMAAMQAIIPHEDMWHLSDDHIAEAAYRMADAMLAERNK